MDYPLPTIRVRELQRREIGDFVTIVQENGYHFAAKEVLAEIFDAQLAKFLVATSPLGRILGTCFLSHRDGIRSLVTALAVRKNCPFRAEIFMELLNTANSYFSCLVYDAIIPTFLCPYFECTNLYVNFRGYWNVHLYCAPTMNLKLKERMDHSIAPYVITPVKETRQCTIVVNFFLERENITTEFNSPLPNAEVIYKLTIEESVVGYGAVSKVGEDEWLIGPVFAHCQTAAKYIFNSIIWHVYWARLRGKVLIYVLEHNIVANQCMNEAGFIKSPETWKKFCSQQMPSTDYYEKMYRKADITMFAMFPLIF